MQSLTFPHGFFLAGETSLTSMLYFIVYKNNKLLKHAKTAFFCMYANTLNYGNTIIWLYTNTDTVFWRQAYTQV